MKRPLYYIQIDGLAATRDLTQDEALQAADIAHEVRPDACIDLVQVNPETGRPLGCFRLFPEL